MIGLLTGDAAVICGSNRTSHQDDYTLFRGILLLGANKYSKQNIKKAKMPPNNE